MRGIGLVRVKCELACDGILQTIHDNSIGRYNMPTHT